MVIVSVLPNGQKGSPLLIIDFLEEASIVLNLAQKVWRFVEEPNKSYEYHKLHLNDHHVPLSTKAECSSSYLTIKLYKPKPDTMNMFKEKGPYITIKK